MHWYPHHVGDYKQATSQLSILEDGAYRRILDAYYSTDANVDANALRLHRVCSAVSDAEKEAVDYVVATFFEVRDGKLYQERAHEEIGKWLSKSKKASKAAIERWSKIHANADATAHANADANGDANHQPSTDNHQPSKKDIPQVASDIADALLVSIKTWKPDFKNPSKATLNKWAADIDRAMRIDGRKESQIYDVIKWLPTHEGSNGFAWRSNVLSGKKLRDQFDKLTIAMESCEKKPIINTRRPDGFKPTAKKFVRPYDDQ